MEVFSVSFIVVLLVATINVFIAAHKEPWAVLTQTGHFLHLVSLYMETIVLLRYLADTNRLSITSTLAYIFIECFVFIEPPFDL